MGRNTALCYVRKSFIRKGEETVSPERQLADCEAYCQRKGWQVQVFQDADEGTHYSGRSVRNRPGWLALLRRLHDPDVVAVVVSALDRASRSTKDFYDFLDSCHKAGVAFVSTSQEIDTSTASGKFMLEMLAGLAAFEGNVAADRVNATIAHQKSKGLYWGYPPFGCTRQQGGLLVPNSDITIVRRGLELYAEGRSFDSVAQSLNAVGLQFRSRDGERVPFKASNIRTLVGAAPLYAGFLYDGRAKDLDPDAPLRRAAHEPMISESFCEVFRTLGAYGSSLRRGPLAPIY